MFANYIRPNNFNPRVVCPQEEEEKNNWIRLIRKVSVCRTLRPIPVTPGISKAQFFLSELDREQEWTAEISCSHSFVRVKFHLTTSNTTSPWPIASHVIPRLSSPLYSSLHKLLLLQPPLKTGNAKFVKTLGPQN